MYQVETKTQNVVYLTGWVLKAHLKTEGPAPLTHLTVRSDTKCYGGHHQLVVPGDLAERLWTAYCTKEAERASKNIRCLDEEVDRLGLEELSELYLEVAVNGHLDGNRVIVDLVRFLNLPAAVRAQLHQGATSHKGKASSSSGTQPKLAKAN